MSARQWEGHVAALLSQIELAGVTAAQAEVFRAHAFAVVAQHGAHETAVRMAEQASCRSAIVIEHMPITGIYGQEQVDLLSEIAGALHCRTVYRADFTRGTLIGVVSHVERAATLFDCLVTQLVDAVLTACPKGAWPSAARARKSRRSFAISWADHIGDRLHAAEQCAAAQVGPGAASMLLDDDQRAGDEMHRSFPEAIAGHRKSLQCDCRETSWIDAGGVTLCDGLPQQPRRVLEQG